jgi:hypothetical protein
MVVNALCESEHSNFSPPPALTPETPLHYPRTALSHPRTMKRTATCSRLDIIPRWVGIQICFITFRPQIVCLHDSSFCF